MRSASTVHPLITTGDPAADLANRRAPPPEVADQHHLVDITFLQPVISYTFPTRTGIFLNSERTSNWDQTGWTIPIDLNVSQLARIGNQPGQFPIVVRYFAEKRTGGPERGIRAAMVLAFPQGR